MSERISQKIVWSQRFEAHLPVTNAELGDWFNALGKTHSARYALIHADDGVIWGKFSASGWEWSSTVFPSVSPVLQLKTLQQLRVFGATAEVFVWREGEDLKGRVITDGVGGDSDCFDEDQLLWGYADRAACQCKNGFCLMEEGSQGLRHAPPEEIARRGMITTRNYIGYDNDDCAFVLASRLVAK